jgi:hypothetical protein
MPAETDRAAAQGPIRAPQNFAGGLLLIGLAAFALWATSSLSQGTLRSMGPAMLPRWLAFGVGLCGVALVVSAFLKIGDAMEGWSLRGPVVVLGAIILFAITIRPFDLGFAQTPALGLAAAGPLAIIVGGYASPEARLRELVILALALTSFCMILFGDLLNLPIPLYPQWLADLLPAGWSNDGRLRAVAGIFALAAGGIWLATRGQGASEPVDVAPPSQRY